MGSNPMANTPDKSTAFKFPWVTVTYVKPNSFTMTWTPELTNPVDNITFDMGTVRIRAIRLPHKYATQYRIEDGSLWTEFEIPDELKYINGSDFLVGILYMALCKMYRPVYGDEEAEKLSHNLTGYLSTLGPGEPHLPGLNIPYASYGGYVKSPKTDQLFANKVINAVDSMPGALEQVRHPVTGGIGFLKNVIVNLNDQYKWTREEIADWLDTLDIDLSFKVDSTENGEFL